MPIREILGSSLAHEGVKSRRIEVLVTGLALYDKSRRKIANAATLEPSSTKAATKASGPMSDGPPEVGIGLTVAGELGLAVAVAVGESAPVLRTLGNLKGESGLLSSSGAQASPRPSPSLSA